MTAITSLISAIFQVGVKITDAFARRTGRVVDRVEKWFDRKPGEDLLPVGGGSAGFYAVVVGRTKILNGKTWLTCKRVTMTSNGYDQDSPDIVVFGGVDPWFGCGDLIAAIRMVAPPQGDEPYPMTFYALMNPPVDQTTLDEPTSSCIVASPVPCVAEPPDPDPCILQP